MSINILLASFAVIACLFLMGYLAYAGLKDVQKNESK